MAGVAQQDAHGMARKVATRLSMVAAAGLATSYGWHRFFAKPYSQHNTSGLKAIDRDHYCRFKRPKNLELGWFDSANDNYIYSPDRLLFVAIEDLSSTGEATINIYDAKTKKKQLSLGRYREASTLTDVRWHPDSKKIVISGFLSHEMPPIDVVTKVVDVPTSKIEARWRGKAAISGFSKDGTQLALIKAGKKGAAITIFDRNPSFSQRIANFFTRIFWTQPQQPALPQTK